MQLFPVDPGAEYPFNHLFQRYMNEQVTLLVSPSSWFSEKYGEDWKLTFNLSARWTPDSDDTDRGVRLSDSDSAKLSRYRSFTPEPLRVELRGPAVYKKDKDVEYSIFLPFGLVNESEDPPACALAYIFAGVYEVLERMQVDTAGLRAEQQRIIDHVCSEPKMFRAPRHPGSGIGPPVWPIRTK